MKKKKSIKRKSLLLKRNKAIKCSAWGNFLSDKLDRVIVKKLRVHITPKNKRTKMPILHLKKKSTRPVINPSYLRAIENGYSPIVHPNWKSK